MFKVWMGIVPFFKLRFLDVCCLNLLFFINGVGGRGGPSSAAHRKCLLSQDTIAILHSDLTVSGPLFSDILMSFGHFLVIFWVLGCVWHLGGSLGGQSGQTWSTARLGWTTLGTILDHLFDEKVVYFCVVFCMPLWIAFLLIFHDFSNIFESIFGVFLITF